MKPTLRFLSIGIAILFVASFFDNVRGPLLPIFSSRYGLSYSQAAVFLWAASATSFVVSVLSVRLFSLWPEATYVRVALLFQTAAIVLAAGGCYPSLIVSGLFWGASTTVLGMCCNLVALRGATHANRPRVLSALHVFYCLGSILPAFYVARTAERWPLNAIVLSMLVLIPALAAATFALPSEGSDAAPAPQMPWSRMLRGHPLVSASCISVYIIGETLTVMWLATYLAGTGLSVTQASGFLQAYFLAMAASRLAGAFFLRSGLEARLPGPLIVCAIAALGVGLSGHRWGFLLAALAFGPVFPLLATSLSQDYPRHYPSLIAFFYAIAMVCLACGHVAIGWLSDHVSLRAAYCLPSLYLLIALGLLILRSRMPVSPERN